MAAAVLALSGCGQNAPLPWRAKQTGFVDLSTLVHRNPAWSNVVYYDRMIASIPPDTTAPSWSGPRQAVLPALPPPVQTKTDLALSKQQAHLEQVRNREITELTERLAQAREYRLRVESYAWRREQKTKTDAEIQRLNAEYTAEVAAETRKADVKLVNLKLQVAALEQLLSKDSQWVDAPPPTPKVDAARVRLAEKTKELNRARDEESAMLIALQSEHRLKLDRAVQEGAQAVDAIRTQKESEYRAADARDIELAKTRLQSGMQAVLEEVGSAENRTWIQSTAPSARNVAFDWPRPPTRTLQSERRIEVDRLAAQRQRWIDYVNVNTRLAVADVAAKRHWNISIVSGGAPARPSAHDMTPQVAAALSSGLWKDNG